MHKSQKLDYFESSLALFFFPMPFPFTGSFVAHFIVFLGIHYTIYVFVRTQRATGMAQTMNNSDPRL